MIPFFSTDGNYCIIQATNKRDDTLALYSNFTREDETWIGEFAKAIFMALFPTEENDPRDIIKRVIRKQASNINTYSLIKTIRNAAQRLLDCDRATVFIRDGDHLIVRA